MKATPILWAILAALLLTYVLPKDSFGQGFFIGNRWSQTATNNGILSQGDATTLTWGFLRDGTAITPALSGESSDPSSLINFLDTNIGAGGGGSDLTNRPWFRLFEESYDRWGDVSGLSFNYEAADNGDDIRDFPAGELGVVADMRIGGHSIDGQTGGNTLAYNYFPNAGDMVIDTDNVTFYSNGSDDHIRLRNVIMHEVGHGLGISHLVSDDSRFLMEPFIDVSFDGPQFAEILAVHRMYGDNNEENGGNDVAGDATSLGEVSGKPIVIGEDARTKVIAADAVDFVSIDGTSDTDFFSFEVTGMAKDIKIDLTPLGPTYHAERQDGTDSNTFDSSAQNDLTLTLFDTDGSTILETSNINGLGGVESIKRLLATGTYFIRITGAQNEAQFFELEVASVPEPGALAMMFVLVAVGSAFYWKKRRKNHQAAQAVS